ncbi:glutathione S-transferase family protein [Litorilituus sediminis]|uniref:glutathione transferase n=1 Tax=Litorilituus sediminis TaxID=718192 RepID=A0A4P6P7L6_9GAMM|nr:glutathione S-transferase family protein [Litorilituus sediminis]QBG36229.1 glutathione S-transferase family protein [Litorilituus sediminis]
MSQDSVHIYGPKFSNFVRTVMLVCEEKGIDYQTGFTINNDEISFKSEQHFTLHPFGKLPVLIHNELTLPETASICRYLDNNFAGIALQPKEPLAHAKHDALCALISIDIDKALVRDYLAEFAFPKGENGEARLDVAKQAQDKVRKALTVISNELASSAVISVDNDSFNIADTLIAPMLHYITQLPESFNLLAEFPVVEKYLAKLMTRKSCQKVLQAKPLPVQRN